jgi:hypothetical protein
MRASPQNATLGQIARLLRGAQQFAGQYQVDPRVPLLGGTGVDELFSLPGAASLAEDVSYYGPRALVRGGNLATGGIGTFRADPRVVDAADVALTATGIGSLAKAPVSAGAMALGRAGERLAERVVPQVMERGGFGAQALQDLAMGSRSQVVKPKGGNWLAGSVERSVEPMRAYLPSEEMIREAGMNPDVPARHASLAMNKWLDQKLGKYIRNEMATPEDPLRALAERGIMHSEITPTGYNVARARRKAGFPEEGMGVSPMAKAWEDRADTFINELEAFDLTSAYPEVVKDNPWLLKVPPETRVYDMLRGSDEDLGFAHLTDELRNAINPESGLPRELMLKYSDLEKVTVPQAVERVAKINDWRAAQKVEADMARAMNPATQVVKEYPEQGFKWVELRKPQETGKNIEVERPELDLPPGFDERQAREVAEDMAYDEGLDAGTPEFDRYVARTMEDFNRKEKVQVDEAEKALEDALKYEGETMGHCVGGYCPDVIEGRSRIYSLRDDKGRPHVTIEVAPRNITAEEAIEMAKSEGFPEKGMDTLFRVAEIMGSGKFMREDIVQIKGKGNKAPKEDYLPAVQDFVRSGNFGKVGDLGNAGLADITKYDDRLKQAAQEAYGSSRFLTNQEMDALMKSQRDAGFARGGAVDLDSLSAKYAEGGSVRMTSGGANFPTDAFDPARIDAIVGELHAMNAG